VSPAPEVDVAIVGGGLVGASLALALAPLPLRVALIEGAAPDAAAQPSFDDRTTALGNGSRRVFESLGVWAGILPEAAPIRRIHVSDAGRFGFARLDATEQDIDAFGYVVTNRVLGRALRAGLERAANAGRGSLELRQPARVVAASIDVEAAVLSIDASAAAPAAPAVGSTLRARLVVAADGAQSLVREAAGLDAAIEDYGQVALTAHVVASRPADGTAYERFASGGPLAVLPLRDGSHGVVWALDPEAAKRMLALGDADYLAALQEAFGWRIGRLLRVGRRSAYPLRLARAERVVGARTVLVGNAAQALHPVAGQGFNLGLRDAATLAELLAAGVSRAHFDAGDPALLEEFARRRNSDRDGVTRFTDGLVRLFGSERSPVAAARDVGLLLFDLAPPAKSALSRVSWGFAGRTPRLARGLALEP
jgi:2-octaprenyl-6-methoxyphenol hydroxylase